MKDRKFTDPPDGSTGDIKALSKNQQDSSNTFMYRRSAAEMNACIQQCQEYRLAFDQQKLKEISIRETDPYTLFERQKLTLRGTIFRRLAALQQTLKILQKLYEEREITHLIRAILSSHHLTEEQKSFAMEARITALTENRSQELLIDRYLAGLTKSLFELSAQKNDADQNASIMQNPWVVIYNQYDRLFASYGDLHHKVTDLILIDDYLEKERELLQAIRIDFLLEDNHMLEVQRKIPGLHNFIQELVATNQSMTNNLGNNMDTFMNADCHVNFTYPPIQAKSRSANRKVPPLLRNLIFGFGIVLISVAMVGALVVTGGIAAAPLMAAAIGIGTTLLGGLVSGFSAAVLGASIVGFGLGALGAMGGYLSHLLGKKLFNPTKLMTHSEAPVAKPPGFITKRGKSTKDIIKEIPIPDHFSVFNLENAYEIIKEPATLTTLSPTEESHQPWLANDVQPRKR